MGHKLVNTAQAIAIVLSFVALVSSIVDYINVRRLEKKVNQSIARFNSHSTNPVHIQNLFEKEFSRKP